MPPGKSQDVQFVLLVVGSPSLCLKSSTQKNNRTCSMYKCPCLKSQKKDGNPPNGFFTSAPKIFSEIVYILSDNGIAGEKLLNRCFKTGVLTRRYNQCTSNCQENVHFLPSFSLPLDMITLLHSTCSSVTSYLQCATISTAVPGTAYVSFGILIGLPISPARLHECYYIQTHTDTQTDRQTD